MFRTESENSSYSTDVSYCHSSFLREKSNVGFLLLPLENTKEIKSPVPTKKPKVQFHFEC